MSSSMDKWTKKWFDAGVKVHLPTVLGLICVGESDVRRAGFKFNWHGGLFGRSGKIRGLDLRLRYPLWFCQKGVEVVRYSPIFVTLTIESPPFQQKKVNSTRFLSSSLTNQPPRTPLSTTPMNYCSQSINEPGHTCNGGYWSINVWQRLRTLQSSKVAFIK